MAPMIAMISERQHTTNRMQGRWGLRDWHQPSGESEERPCGARARKVSPWPRADRSRRSPALMRAGPRSALPDTETNTGTSRRGREDGLVARPSSSFRCALRAQRLEPATRRNRAREKGLARHAAGGCCRRSSAGATSGPAEEIAAIRPGNAQGRHGSGDPAAGSTRAAGAGGRGPCPASRGCSRRDRDLPVSHARVVAPWPCRAPVREGPDTGRGYERLSAAGGGRPAGGRSIHMEPRSVPSRGHRPWHPVSVLVRLRQHRHRLSG
jgi:hypothetical protein